MASQGMHGFGAAIYSAGLATAAPVADPPSAPWAETAEVKRLAGPGLESSDVDLTHLKSPDKAKEYMAGFMDAGQIAFTLNYNKAGHTLMLTAFPAAAAGGQSTSNIRWLVRFPDAGFLYCEGFVKSMPTEVPEDGPVTSDVTIKLSGKPTWIAL